MNEHWFSFMDLVVMEKQNPTIPGLPLKTVKFVLKAKYHVSRPSPLDILTTYKTGKMNIFNLILLFLVN